MPAIVVELTYADGRRHRQELDKGSILMGNDGTSDVVLEAPEIAPRQLLLIPRRDGCWVSAARDTAVRPFVGGERFESGTLPWGTEIDVGSVIVRFDRPTVRHGKNRVVFFGVALILAVAGSELWTSEMDLPVTTLPPPDLFGTGETTCEKRDRALEDAQVALLAADALESRYPFDSRDGIAAVDRLSRAAACLEVAGRTAETKAVLERHRSLRTRIAGDFKAHKVILDRSLVARELDGVLRAARAMSMYLHHRPGPYRDWLVALERRALAARDLEQSRKKP
jgi:hypothetical protein